MGRNMFVLPECAPYWSSHCLKSCPLSSAYLSTGSMCLPIRKSILNYFVSMTFSRLGSLPLTQTYASVRPLEIKDYAVWRSAVDTDSCL